MKGDQRIIVECKIYAPRDTHEQTKLFNVVRRLKVFEAIILMGADFNCTLDPEFERSHCAYGST